jgi:hypothetical protein
MPRLEPSEPKIRELTISFGTVGSIVFGLHGKRALT